MNFHSETHWSYPPGLAGTVARLENGPRETDSFGRRLAYTFTAEGFSIDIILIGDGLAESWTRDGQHRDSLVGLEQSVRLNKAGCLWGDLIVGDISSSDYDPSGPDRDCGDFVSQGEAQVFFETAGGPTRDPHRLDRDGVPCESLP